MKKIKKIINKIKKGKKSVYSIIVIIVLLVLGFLSFNLEGSDVTGSAVYVSYYGVSNYPFNLNKVCGSTPYCNKGVQTKVTIAQPELGKLKIAGTAIDVAGKIVSVVDSGSNIVSLFQGSTPTPIPTDALGVVTSASGAIIEQFKKETSCLSKIGELYGAKDKIEVGVISYLTYKTCSYYPDWFYAYIQHEYRTLDGKLICRQESTKLFSIEQGTGKISKSTMGC